MVPYYDPHTPILRAKPTYLQLQLKQLKARLPEARSTGFGPAGSHQSRPATTRAGVGR